MYYCNTKYYNPLWCRWLNADSVEYLEPDNLYGMNLFAYCNNNPVMYSDRDGHMPKWLKWVIWGVTFVGAVALTVLTGGALAPVFIGLGVSIVSGALIQGTINAIQGESFWQ